MAYVSINPYNGKELKRYNELTDNELKHKLELSYSVYNKWKELQIEERLKYLPLLSNSLKKHLEHHAKLISLEMGKPIKQSRAEIEKCISACDYYLKNAKDLLKPEIYPSYADESYVICQPIGIIYGIMPWNFPYWQVFRYVIPNLVLGNTVILKHASNVPQCAEGIETLIHEAGFPEGAFQNLYISYSQSDWLIEHEYVRGITLTGSEAAASKVASLAGKNIKKTVMELGGSDPFIVFDYVEPDKVIDHAVFARMQNTGQSCIAAKRFFVHENNYDEFVAKFSQKIRNLKIGDPLDENTDIGPMAAEYLLNELDDQVKRSVESGGNLICGGKRLKTGSLCYEPTIIATSNLNLPVCREETFGPVIVIIKFSEDDNLIQMVNDTVFGLGASIWTRNIALARDLALKIDSGMVTINGIVKSDPALPFGGTKASGFGRELSAAGLKEFSNPKTITLHY